MRVLGDLTISLSFCFFVLYLQQNKQTVKQRVCIWIWNSTAMNTKGPHKFRTALNLTLLLFKIKIILIFYSSRRSFIINRKSKTNKLWFYHSRPGFYPAINCKWYKRDLCRAKLELLVDLRSFSPWSELPAVLYKMVLIIMNISLHFWNFGRKTCKNEKKIAIFTEKLGPIQTFSYTISKRIELECRAWSWIEDFFKWI